MKDSKPIISLQGIQDSIFLIRGYKVILDVDLAGLYGVKTKVLNQAVKRNLNRFPNDFMFSLAKAEKQEVVTACDHLQKLKRFENKLTHHDNQISSLYQALQQLMAPKNNEIRKIGFRLLKEN